MREPRYSPDRFISRRTEDSTCGSARPTAEPESRSSPIWSARPATSLSISFRALAPSSTTRTGGRSTRFAGGPDVDTARLESLGVLVRHGKNLLPCAGGGYSLPDWVELGAVLRWFSGPIRR